MLTISTSKLPAPLNSIIKQRDVHVKSTETVINITSHANDGEKGFVRVIDTNRGKDHTNWGEWGANNPFIKSADDTPMSFSVDPGVYIISGYIGGMSGPNGRVVTVYMNPLDIPKLETYDAELSNEETKALYLIRNYNSKGRKESFPRNSLGVYGNTNPIVASLASKGFLKLTGAGVSVTELGSNHKINYLPGVY